MPEFGGEVTNPKVFIRNKIITPDGLLSEQIFGPIKSYTCRCGKFTESTRSMFEGQTCERCGIKCISNESRWTTFGKITLPFYVIKPTRIKYLKPILGEQNMYLIDPKRADASAALSRFLAIDGQKLRIIDTLDNSNFCIIPLRITGIYSLTLALRYAANYLHLPAAESLFNDKHITNVIKVLPPNIRPIIKDPKNPQSIIVTDINKPYESLLLLNVSNNVVKQILPNQEYNWFELINYNLKNNLKEEIVDYQIIDYDKSAARYQYYTNLLYEMVFKSISGKYGYIRYALLGRTIEFSARSVIVVDPSIPPYKVRVSKKILYKLWFPYFLYYLKKNHKDLNYIDLYNKYVNVDYEDIKDLFNEFLNYFVKDGEKEEQLKQSTTMKIVRKNISAQ